MIKNSAGKLYVGFTKDPAARLKTHNSKRGARFTRYIPTYEVVFLEQYGDITMARAREKQIKGWRRGKKDFLIRKYLQNKPSKTWL